MVAKRCPKLYRIAITKVDDCMLLTIVVCQRKLGHRVFPLAQVTRNPVIRNATLMRQSGAPILVQYVDCEEHPLRKCSKCMNVECRSHYYRKF